MVVKSSQKLVFKQRFIKDFFESEDIFKTKVSRLDDKLDLCDRHATKKFYCKKGHAEHLIKTTHSRFHCEIRYCTHPDCLVQRYKRQMETFNDITSFDGLNNLWHFSIGFPTVSELDFKNNFSQYKRRFETVLNRFWEKLKQGYVLDENLKYVLNSKGENVVAPIILRGVRVLDFSFKTEGQVFIHYHFGIKPVGRSLIKRTMEQMHRIIAKMEKKMRIKTPFSFESFGLREKQATLSYLSIRASGMYKYDMTKNTKYKHIKGNLRESIKKEKYIFINKVFTKEDYIKHFYNKAAFVTVGGLPRPARHGSNITDGMPCECIQHGALERKDIRVEILFEDLLPSVAPPPDMSREMYNIKVVRIS